MRGGLAPPLGSLSTPRGSRQGGAMYSTNVDKSFAHAYLAAMRDPLARVGEGALQGVWDFGSPAFSELVGFLRVFASRSHQA